MLFLHDLDIFRPNQHTYFRAGQVLVIVLNQELIVIRCQHTHLVVYALEDTTLHLAVPFREFPLRHAIFYVILFIHSHLTALLIFLAPNINIFRSDNNIHRIILTETGIDTIELLSAERNTFVTNHRTAQNITLADKVRHKAVLRLIVDIRRCTDLLDLTFAHHHHTVTQRQRLFLIVRHVDKRDTQFLVQLFQLDLHVVAHLQIQRTQRLVEQQHLGLVHNSARDSYTLLLTTAQGIYLTLLVARQVRHFQRLTHFLLDRLRIFLLQLQTEGDIIKHIQVREQRVFLEYGVYRALIRRSLCYILTFQQNIAR